MSIIDTELLNYNTIIASGLQIGQKSKFEFYFVRLVNLLGYHGKNKKHMRIKVDTST